MFVVADKTYFMATAVQLTGATPARADYGAVRFGTAVRDQ